MELLQTPYKLPTLEEIKVIESALLKMDGNLDIEELTTSRFCKGLYARELRIPRGCRIVGKTHAEESFFLLIQGEMTIWSETSVVRVKAPFISISKPGDKRVGYAHEDSITMNFHPNPDDEQDITVLEQRYLMGETERLTRQYILPLGDVS